ncbi:MAG: hypothetical protein M3P94_01580, partial [Chloroflexota bacterium]|nr:hypothetical protein [Chloroflexota bacterium]
AHDQTGERRRSPGYSRFVALVVTPLDDPRRADLLALIDSVIERSGYVPTDQGMMPAHVLGRIVVPGKEAA